MQVTHKLESYSLSLKINYFHFIAEIYSDDFDRIDYEAEPFYFDA